VGENFNVIFYKWISYGRGLSFACSREPGQLVAIQVCAAVPGSRLGH